MISRLWRGLAGLMSLMLCVTVVMAQGDCPKVVQNALDIADQSCASTGRNQACYGNITLKAVPQAGIDHFTFNKTGDIVNVADVQSLELSSMDARSQQWGIALLKIQANIPDTLPGQNVTMLLFGDVKIQNSGEEDIADTSSASVPTATASTAAVVITADDTLDVVAEPARDAKVVATLKAGDQLPVDGMDESAGWVHVVLADGGGGWVRASKVTFEGDAGSLPIVSADNAPPTATVEEKPATATPQGAAFGAMHAFYFKSGTHDRPCSEAPDSGILVQSPQGVAGIDLTVDAVQITLGSTAYLQAQPNGDMIIYVVEGHGTAAAFNKTVTIPAGTRVRIPIGADLKASGPPSNPEPYTSGALVGLPLSHMPEVITSAAPLTETDIAALNKPTAGLWTLTYDQAYMDIGCAADAYNGGFSTELGYDHDTLVWYGKAFAGAGYGVYNSITEAGATTDHFYRLVVTSATQIEGQNTWIVPGCGTIVNHFHLVLERAS